MKSVAAEAHRHALHGSAKHRQPEQVVTAATSGRQRASFSVDKTHVELVASIISIADNEPVVEIVLSRDGRDTDRLPSVLFSPGSVGSLEDCLRRPVEQYTGHPIGFLQQLIAFIGKSQGTNILIGFLALVYDTRRNARAIGTNRSKSRNCRWQSCYLYFPWEDWRAGRPRIIDEVIVPELAAWARTADHFKGRSPLSKAAQARCLTERSTRARIAFPQTDIAWDEAKVVTRFELLIEAGLISEEQIASVAPRSAATSSRPEHVLGRVMAAGHRRALAASFGRLRADIKARPVVFELMDDEFSLHELQRTVEVILGPNLHKQNFRRQVETGGLVEPTGGMKSHTGGRPAKLYRFRREILLERPGF